MSEPLTAVRREAPKGARTVEQAATPAPSVAPPPPDPFAAIFAGMRALGDELLELRAENIRLRAELATKGATRA